MFVRFRKSLRRLDVSLAETRRVGGKVRQEHVASLGKLTYSWGIATARRRYHTPRGTYHVTALDIDAYSRKYDAAMPYAVCFIRGDYCIHAGHSIGQNASHGCIRLAALHAIRFFYLVSANRDRTTIIFR